MNRNATYNIIKNIFTIIFPLITFPYISRTLGAENTGKINFGLSIVSYFSLVASLGVTTYAVRECAAVKDDRNALSHTASQIYSINVISTMAAYVALTVTLAVAPSLSSYRKLIVIQSLSILLATLGTDWLNTAMSDFKYITVRTVLVQMTSLLLMLLFVRRTEDFYIYALINVFASGGANVLNMIYRKRYCEVCFTVHMDVKRHLMPILLLFSMLIAQTVFVNTDTTILGLMKGDFEVGLYGASTKVYSMVNSVVASIAWVVMPQLSHLFAVKNYKEINATLRYALNFIVVLGIPVIIGLNVLADEIIQVLAGSEYMGATTSLHILTLSLVCSFAGGFVGNIILLPSKREHIMLMSCIVSAIVNLILNLVLIPRFGLNAAAATTAIANGVSFLIGIPYIEKEIRITGVGKIFKAPLLGGIAVAVVVSVLKLLPTNVYVTTFLSIVIGAVSYFLILLLLKDEFTSDYVKQIRQKFSKKRGVI